MFDTGERQQKLTPVGTPSTLVACIGNSLVGDDAVGCRVFEALQKAALPEKVILRQLELLGIALLDELNGEELLIVVDAVRFGAAPGTLHLLAWDDIPGNDLPAISVHGIGVREAIDVGRVLYPERMPSAVYLVGIEGLCFDRCGVGLSPAVDGAVAEAVDEIANLIARNAKGGTVPVSNKLPRCQELM